MSTTRGEMNGKTLNQRFGELCPFVPTQVSDFADADQDDVESNEAQSELERVYLLLHQAQSEITALKNEREELLDQLDIAHNTGSSPEDIVSDAARKEIKNLVEENRRLQEEVTVLRVLQPDLDSQLNQGHNQGDFSLKELLDIHQHMEKNIQELQTQISQSLSKNTQLNSLEVQGYVTEVWNCLCEQRPHWKTIVTENICLKKHINDLEEALQMKHAENESETQSISGSVTSVSVASPKDDTLETHEKELERYAQLLQEAMEQVAQTEKEKTELEKVNSKWKEYGDYVKNENKELENEVHKRLDEIQKLEERIDELEDGNLLSKLQDKNKQLEQELAKTLEKLELFKHTTDETGIHQDRRSVDMTSESEGHVALASDEERETNSLVIKEMAVQLSELLLKAEQEKDGSTESSSYLASSESLNRDRDDILLKQLDDYQHQMVELQLQVDELQQELNSQKLRNMVLQTQIDQKKNEPLRAIPLKTKEDASTNTDYFYKPTALYTGSRSAKEHHRASLVDLRSFGFETSL